MIAPALGRRSRVAVWFAIALAMMVRYAVVNLDLPYAVTILIADTASYLLPISFVSAGAFYIALGRASGPVERRFWVLVAIASSLLLAGESRWTWWAIAVDPRGPAGSDPIGIVLTMGGSFLLLGIIVTMSRAAYQPFSRRFGLYVDILLALIVLWPPVYFFWTRPLMTAAGGSVVDASVLAARSLVGLAVFVFNIIVVAGWRATGWRPWERLASLALALFGAGMIGTPAWYAQHIGSGGYTPSAFTDTLGGGFALMSAAVVYRLTSQSTRPEETIISSSTALPAGFPRLYPALIAAALPTFVYLVLESIGGPSERPLEAATAVLAAVLALRSWVYSFERARARRDATTDAVTGAFSSVLLEDRLRAALGFAHGEGREVSLLVFGLHELRRVADAHGHAEADAVMRKVSEALTAEAPASAEVFRMGSEEFAVVCPGVGSSEAAAYARRVWLQLTHGSAGDVSSGVDLAAGVATYPTHVTMWEDLLAAAEIARAAARVADADPVVIFEESVAVVPADEHRRRVRMRNLRATVRTLAEAVDARDPATRDHSTNVAELATALAQVLDLPDERVQVVGLAALMHDVGKIGVRDDVLLKSGRLDSRERFEIEEHTILGERILAPAGLDDIPALVRSHHERWDGRGYPDGLSGEEIPLEARILAVCDAFETMTTGRTYSAAVSADEALSEIDAMAGSQFDPAVAAAFIRMVGRLGLKRAAHDLGAG